MHQQIQIMHILGAADLIFVMFDFFHGVDEKKMYRISSEMCVVNNTSGKVKDNLVQFHIEIIRLTSWARSSICSFLLFE